MVQVKQRSANMVHGTLQRIQGMGKQQSRRMYRRLDGGGVHYAYSNAAARLKH